MNGTMIYADAYETTFATPKEMMDFLMERAKMSRWMRKPTKALRLVPLSKGAPPVKDADIEDWEGILWDTEKNTQLALKIRGEIYPVRSCAIKTILDRAGISGAGLRKLETADYTKVVNYCLKVAKGDALIKIADGKVSAVHGIDQVQILTPFRKRSAAGVNELNRTLEDIINPPESGKKELKVGMDVFRVGDKILQNRNTATASNGDMGTIQDFYEDEDGAVKIRLCFSDHRMVEYEYEQMEMTEHANAITIHKAQGSECPIVIIPWVKAFYVMLKRNILYTGITRAKQKVYLVGEWAAVCQAIHNDDGGKRNTLLGKRIQRYFEKYQSEKPVKMEQLRLAV